MNGKLKKTLQGNIKKDLESPYRKVVVTTDLKSDSRISKYHCNMLKTWYLTMNLGNGGGGRRGIKGGPSAPVVDMLDWDISSAAKPHIPSTTLEKSLQNGSITNIIHGGKTLNSKYQSELCQFGEMQDSNLSGS